MEQIARKPRDESDSLGSQRVYKKTSANSVLTLYLGSRDVISKQGVVEPLCGVIYIDPKFMCSQKIYAQLTLTFRYGREDEEVMGLKFCNEAVISLKQIWPQVNYDGNEVTPLQQALLDRLGHGAHHFTLEVGMLAPPSVQLIPAKKYNGAPIGTSYDIRVFMSDLTDEKFQRRTTVKLGIRLMHKIPSDLRTIQQPNPTYMSLPKTIRLRLSPKQLKFHHNKNHHQTISNPSSIKSGGPVTIGLTDDYQAHNSAVLTSHNPRPSSIRSDEANGTNDISRFSSTISTTTSLPSSFKGPEGCVDKPFLWTEGRVSLKASLNKSAYVHGEKILISVDITNNSRKLIRKMRIFAVQHVDVCMFSNGKFKNVVADVNENRQIKPNEIFNHTYDIVPTKGPTKNWIAVESTFTNNNTSIETTSDPSNNYKIASSAHRGPQNAEERNVFAIYVSYYVKVKLTLSGMGGEVSLKLPFILGHVDNSDESNGNESSDHNKDKIGNGKSAKYQTPITTNHHKDNIIEEELHEEPDSISLLNDKHDSKKKAQLNEEKLNQERNLLHRYKLKRDSYSRSCEEIESLSKNDDCNVSAVKAIVHRQASDSND